MVVGRTSIFAVSSLLLTLFAACSSNPPADPSGTASTEGAGAGPGTGTGANTSTGTNATSGSSGSGGDDFDAGATVKTIEAAMGPIAVQPGTEKTQCIVVRLDNAEGAYVRRFRADLGEGSHHMIVYVSNATQEDPEPKDCNGFSGVFKGEHPIFIAQQARADLEFPTDETGTPVAFEIKPNQMVRIEMHYIDATAAPIEVTGKLSLDTVPLSTKVIKSDLAFWGTQQIDIPPNQSFETGIKFQKALAGTKLFALTTHQHQLGTEMLVWYAKDKNDTSHQIADEKNWADPKLVPFSPALVFPGANGETGLTFQCKWKNNTPNQVKFGEGFNEEMCFLWHYYYPSQGFHVCFDSFCQTVK